MAPENHFDVFRRGQVVIGSGRIRPTWAYFPAPVALLIFRCPGGKLDDVAFGQTQLLPRVFHLEPKMSGKNLSRLTVADVLDQYRPTSFVRRIPETIPFEDGPHLKCLTDPLLQSGPLRVCNLLGVGVSSHFEFSLPRLTGIAKVVSFYFRKRNNPWILHRRGYGLFYKSGSPWATGPPFRGAEQDFGASTGVRISCGSIING